MKKKENLFHHSACISLLILILLVFRPDIAACAVPTLDWSGEEGLWNDGVTPDYGLKKSGAEGDLFTFKVKLTNCTPDTGYPKVYILKDGTPVTFGADTSPFEMTHETGGIYAFTTPDAISPAGNDYSYYFEAVCDGEYAYGSPANEHTFTVVTGYVWVDSVDGDDGLGDGSSDNPYASIDTGIDSASPGEAVRVVGGTLTSPYTYEGFTMDVSGVHVVSDNTPAGSDAQTDYENADYYGRNGYYPSMLTRAGSVKITGEITISFDVTLDGIYLETIGPNGIYIQGGSPVIKNSIINKKGVGNSCIRMRSSVVTEPIIENNLIHSGANRTIGVHSYNSPLIQDNEIWDSGAQGIGINWLTDPGNGTVTITIFNNHIFDCGGAGIGSKRLGKQTKTVIQGNTIHHNGQVDDRAGINLAQSVTGSYNHATTIGGSHPGQGNTIFNNGLAGIRLDGYDRSFSPVLIQNNTINNNGKTGILLIDVGLSDDIASILDNEIYGHTTAGINTGGTTYADIKYNLIHHNAKAGIAFNMGDVVTNPGDPSSGTVNIEANEIYSNTMAGIAVRDAITGEVTIAGNDLYQNDRAGICIVNSCNLVINRNDIHDNIRGGIHTGTYVADDYFANSNDECTASVVPYPCCTGLGEGTCNSSVGFIGTTDSALLTVSQNKVHNNGLNSYGGGVDIRHASGSIYNNLIYENHKGGIRFGDYIDEIVNNTVADNGHVVSEFEKYGGGIIYDDLDGAVNDKAGGNPLFSIPIRNNIAAFNVKAGIKVCLPTGLCDTTGTYRDYNLLFGNNNTPIDVTPITWPPWKMVPQLGGCWWNDHEVFADPEFVDRVNDDYRIQDTVTSPAVDTGDPSYGTDVSVPPGVGTTDIDMGAYGGPDGIDW